MYLLAGQWAYNQVIGCLSSRYKRQYVRLSYIRYERMSKVLQDIRMRDCPENE